MTFDTLSTLASQNIPFLFYTDYKGEKIDVVPLQELKKSGIKYSINKKTIPRHTNISLIKEPLPYHEYLIKFNQVIDKIKSGETYLLNLTQPTPITTNITLLEIFNTTQATYKLYVKDTFVCFSPEPFITIEGNTIRTFPMKGTIDASIPNAKEKILANEKEMAEHIMVVDLLRNDLGMVATNIHVDQFRYIQKINAGEKELLQVSSQISGTLTKNWKNNLGNILKTLLPAGSITGTPKRSTMNIIENVENYERGYYSGVFGLFDGEKLETSVMIRFIEQNREGLVYKSGGGITLDSDPKEEYQELIDKVYIP
jgi:para-aminobenzoate synthetase component 1